MRGLTRRSFLAATGMLLLPGKALATLSVEEAARAPLLVSRDEALGGRLLASGPRTLAAVATPRFDLVGLHWRGDGEVRFRTGSVGGRWSAWRRAHEHELPENGSSEAERSEGWRLAAPLWTSGSDRIQYRLDGEVDALRAHFVSSWPAPRAQAARRLSSAGSPPIIPRLAWRADESIVRAASERAEQLRFAVVHHTAGPTPSSPAESAAIVRAIQIYHVRGNGWNDIGYNLLVDRFGQVFEGRAGSVESNVVGAHAQGFNATSLGVAVLGDYERGALSSAARGALAKVIAWRFDLAHIDPLTLVTALSGGNGRFTELVPVTLPAVCGHRDLDFTLCPGSRLYPDLGLLAANASAIGLPKLYEPLVEGAIGAPIRFRARLSQPLAWRVAVTDGAGAVVAEGDGFGADLDWTWDATTAPQGTYVYSLVADGVRPAVGTLAVGPEERLRTPPARPSGTPRAIPAWAWQLHTWHATQPDERGPRPRGAPRPLPAWYWPWRRWRRSIEVRGRLLALLHSDVTWEELVVDPLWALYLQLSAP
ncbi:MAG: peptidoglycan recognition protein [Gaiellaceae bacterium MAG52_C11]|nr:peptidoglycan recognition protein [Candidatus Gaiellasilicea maunaloa]